MSTYTAERAVHKTLSGTTADTVTLGGGYDRVQIIERGGTNPLWVSWDGSMSPPTAVPAGDNCEYVAPGGFVEIDTNSAPVSIVGASNPYSVIGSQV